MLRRRFRIPDPGPSDREREEARRAVSEAVKRLDEAIKRDPVVTDRARKLEQIHRENNLAPKIEAVLRIRPC